jgi:hypothetical protein
MAAYLFYCYLVFRHLSSACISGDSTHDLIKLLQECLNSDVSIKSSLGVLQPERYVRSYPVFWNFSLKGRCLLDLSI